MRLGTSLPPYEKAETASYVIYKQGNVIYAKNGESGAVEFSGTDAATVIQQAIDHVADKGGGKIFIRTGTYIVARSLSFENKSNIIIVGGKKTILKLADSANCDVINIVNAQRIRIENIEIDGNKVNQTAATSHGIEINNSSNVVIANVYIHDTKGAAVGVRDSTHISIRDSVHEDTDGDSDFAFNVDYFEFINNICRNYFDTGIAYFGKYGVIIGNIFEGGTVGVYLGTAGVKTENVVVAQNSFKSHAESAILVEEPRETGVEPTENISIVGNVIADSKRGIFVRGKDYSGVRNATIADNTILRCETYGIYLDTLKPDTSPVVAINITNNVVAFCGAEGISLARTRHCLVMGNIAVNNGQSGNQPGILLYGDDYGEARYNFVIGNKCFDNQATKTQGYGIREYRSDYNVIVYNDVRDNLHGGIQKAGVNTVVKHNIGYITENSGTATISAGNTYVDVPHGLAAAPDISKVRVTPRDDLGGRSFWVEEHPTDPDTYFRIYISSSDTVDHLFNWYAEI
ncbi:hypothetical protein DRO31_08325 [Candidatus Bathyarchaeota archaeon]|nr:MAG: hypothetical protein DRO31_08325 [Candidatus Bathyarchaeota archaeon]